jgi:hypothetical protein
MPLDTVKFFDAISPLNSRASPVEGEITNINIRAKESVINLVDDFMD